MAATFRGSFKSTVRARAAGASKPSITLQPFYMLHLDIQQAGVRSVEDALDVLTLSEHLSDYKVKGSSVPVEADKTTRLHKLPQMLMLHINRFAYDAERNATVKLHQHIAFPPLLRLRPQWLSDDCPDRRGAAGGYRLVASIIHHGRNSSSGHYSAHVQQPDGRWLHFNDAAVSPVSLHQVLQERTYVLVYQKA
ncbi:MAG: hypothetical protein J3K34DRAFT_400419 [Monoraphidium minutum]|nr:MAG: hypothetical protein J3K34DRAFT_400419 [Monoraphidium minutum]